MASSGDAYTSPRPAEDVDVPVHSLSCPGLTQGPAPAKLAQLRAVRVEVESAAREARLKGLWKHQVRVFDFYHDYGRERPYVQATVANLIVANFLCDIAPWQWDPEPDVADRRHKALWFTLDYTFNLAFLVELLLNMYSKWMRPFFRDGWNVFDLVVVTVGAVDMLQIPVSHTIKMVRLFRAFRVFRLLKRVDSLRNIVDAIGSALPAVFNVLVILSILISIYAIIAVDLFGDLYSGYDEDPVPGAITARGNCYGKEYYGTFASALYTLFQILTGESWSEAGVRPILHYYSSVRRDSLMVAATAVFFVSFILINSIILLNVIVAVLLDGLMRVLDGTQGPTTAAAAAEVLPESARHVEENLRALRAEVADLNGRMAAIITRQRNAGDDPPNMLE